MSLDSLNVFDIFIKDDGNYQFVDMGIAFGSSENWSYPTWPSHLDHILISNELFDDFENPGSKVETIHIENYFDDIMSIESVGIYKPDSKVYEMPIKKYNCNPEDICFMKIGRAHV